MKETFAGKGGGENTRGGETGGGGGGGSPVSSFLPIRVCISYVLFRGVLIILPCVRIQEGEGGGRKCTKDSRRYTFTPSPTCIL